MGPGFASEGPKDSTLGKFVQDANARICSTPNSVGHVRTRNQSMSIRAELSEVEDHGDDTH